MAVIVKVPDLEDEIELEGDDLFKDEEGNLQVFKGDRVIAYFREGQWDRAVVADDLDEDAIDSLEQLANNGNFQANGSRLTAQLPDEDVSADEDE